MTGTKTFELALEVWWYRKKHPEIARKGSLPPELWEKIEDFPLHSVFCESSRGDCKECPIWLHSGCPLYEAWLYADSDDERQAVVQAICRKLAEGYA
jgi:hypothetical protein